MNFFAHLILAEPTAQSRFGNLLGDFCRGVDIQSLPSAVRAGLYRHRAIDRFTDAADQVKTAKLLFSAQRRRFAPIILDVLFDHFLLRHWSRFDPRDLATLISQIYQDLWQQRAQMPAAMALTVTSIVEHDWFGSYQSLEGVGLALDRIAGRLRFPHQFSGAITEIRQHELQLEALFLQFYPQLQAYVGALGAETDRPDRTQ